jgi:hypothetical protein
VTAWRLAAPLPALLLGLWVMRGAGVGALQAGAGVAALALAVAVARSASVDRRAPVVAAAGVVLALATLAAPGLNGVHRWIPLGPLALHVSPLAAPWALRAMDGGLRAGRFGWAATLALGLQGVHAAQPDAGQATAFAAGAIALLVPAAGPRRLRAVLGLALAALAAVAWARPDPLAPVPHVEGIVRLAIDQGLGVAAVAALALLAAAPLLGGRPALSAYLAAAVGVTAFGAFPVPVLGFGVSGLVGAWLAIALSGSPRPAPADRRGPAPVSPPAPGSRAAGGSSRWRWAR